MPVDAMLADISRLLAQKVEYEEALLGTCLVFPEAIDEAVSILGNHAESVFTRDEHNRHLIWWAIRDLHMGSEPVEMLAVEERLATKNCPRTQDLRDYMLLLSNSAVSTAGVGYNSRCLMDAYQRLTAHRMFRAAMGHVLDQSAETLELLSRYSRDLAGLADSRSRTPQSARDVGGAIVADALDGVTVPCVPTGMETLDEALLGGFRAGDLIILAARPSVGKTALALQIAVAVSASRPALFCSLEMSKESLCRRLLSALSGVYPGKLLHPERMTPYDREALSATDLPSNLLIDESGSPTGTELAARARLARRRSRIELLVVDYLQLMSQPGGENRNNELSAITRMTKTAATELGIPVLMLSQLNRDPAKSGRAPRLHDLRDSGSIEQDADIVLMLHNTESRDREHFDPNREYAYQLLIEKQRNGPVSKLDLWFKPGITTFYDAPKSVREGAE